MALQTVYLEEVLLIYNLPVRREYRSIYAIAPGTGTGRKAGVAAIVDSSTSGEVDSGSSPVEFADHQGPRAVA